MPTSTDGTALSPLATEIGALATVRDGTYRAYRRQLGPAGEHLPEGFDEVVAAVIAFADPVIDRAAAPRRWNPTERRWEHQSTG